MSVDDKSLSHCLASGELSSFIERESIIHNKDVILRQVPLV